MNANELIEKCQEFEDTIAKLTEPIRDVQDALTDITEQVKGFREQLESSKADEDKKFKRVGCGEIYYYVSLSDTGKFTVYITRDNLKYVDKLRFYNNNYFLTIVRAQEVADKLNTIMCVERIHDEYPEAEVKIDVQLNTSNYNIPCGVEIFSRYYELLKKYNI